MVLNLAPIGCYPWFLVELPHNKSDIDEFGCMVSYNNAVVEYNKMLKKSLVDIKQQLLDANVINVDIYTILLDLFQHPTSHGINSSINYYLLILSFILMSESLIKKLLLFLVI